MAGIADLGVEIDFANGPSFGYPFTLDDPFHLFLIALFWLIALLIL
jgi:hypothetical protein